MSIDFSLFDESAVAILKKLATNFPVATEIAFNDIFPDSFEVDHSAHKGAIAFLRHESFIAHDSGSISAFILTSDGLALFQKNVVEHLKSKLS